MSVVTDAIKAIKETLKLTDDVARAAQAVKDLAQEVRDHEHRLTRIEASWETVMALAARPAPPVSAAKPAAIRRRLR
jgi:hypothetical protein